VDCIAALDSSSGRDAEPQLATGTRVTGRGAPSLKSGASSVRQATGWRHEVHGLSTIILVALAMVIGSALRFIDLTGVPPSLNQDEAVNGYDAYSLFWTGRDHHGHLFPLAGLESFGDWVSPLLTFLTSPAVGVLGLRVDVVRGVCAAVGVLAIPVLYRLGVELFSRRTVGVVAAWYMALDPWAVHRSRFAIPPSIVPTTVALTMLALVWAVRRHRTRGIIALGFTAGLAVASYPTMKLYIPLLLCVAVLVYWPTFRYARPAALISGGLIFAAISGPILYISLFDPAGRARLEQVNVFNRKDLTVSFLLHQYETYISPHVFLLAGNGHPAQAPTPPGYGVVLRVVAPFLLIGLLVLLTTLWNRSLWIPRRSAALVLSALVLYPIPGALTLPTPPLVGPDLARATHLIPLLALLVGIGFVVVADFVRSNLWDGRSGTRRAAALLLAITIGGGLFTELLVRYRYYFVEYPQQSATLNYFQYGLAQTTAYAHAHERQYRTIWITPVNQPYIYVLFYAQWPPGDVQRHLRLIRHPPAFNQVTSLDMYRFTDPPVTMRRALRSVYTVRDPDGSIVYDVRAGQIPKFGRILWINKP
jgi:4-amino-4-deoxy-L-arabinose transferase-like glycosyltransferase